MHGKRGLFYLAMATVFAVVAVIAVPANAEREKEGERSGGRESGKGMKAEKAADSMKARTAEEQVKIAMSGAPKEISADATIFVFGEDGKLAEAKKGTNGFTCLPWIDNPKDPDPICMDAAAYQWLTDAMNKAPKPTNTVPGIAYMARGGIHYEKDGKVLMENADGAKTVKEPAHWMIFWPFDQGTVRIPSMPDKFGAWIMWEGTPYSHLMIHQDPMKMDMKKHAKHAK